ncbi:hypothetical protein FH972_025585 [Carpinus fangiana]|uniref:HMG box domain-containing protein n=1 Tax=Carpinus fangiana TaxID=176857 RepID=A0A5N6L217_9ROSI|nr:hypothetical protein FH972_025585 [Carpinus fangiana]
MSFGNFNDADEFVGSQHIRSEADHRRLGRLIYSRTRRWGFDKSERALGRKAQEVEHLANLATNLGARGYSDGKESIVPRKIERHGHDQKVWNTDVCSVGVAGYLRGVSASVRQHLGSMHSNAQRGIWSTGGRAEEVRKFLFRGYGKAPRCGISLTQKPTKLHLTRGAISDFRSGKDPAIAVIGCRFVGCTAAISAHGYPAKPNRTCMVVHKPPSVGHCSLFPSAVARQSLLLAFLVAPPSRGLPASAPSPASSAPALALVGALNVMRIPPDYRRKLQLLLAADASSSKSPSKSDAGARSSKRSMQEDSDAQPSSPGKVPRRKYKRHPKPDVNAPERPLTAYVRFSKDKRKEYQERRLSFSELAKQIGIDWQDLSPTLKNKYLGDAASDWTAFRKALDEYHASDQYADYVQYLRDFATENPDSNVKLPQADLSASPVQHASDPWDAEGSPNSDKEEIPMTTDIAQAPADFDMAHYHYELGQQIHYRKKLCEAGCPRRLRSDPAVDAHRSFGIIPHTT